MTLENERAKKMRMSKFRLGFKPIHPASGTKHISWAMKVLNKKH